MPTQARAQRTRAALLAAAEREFAQAGYAATTAKRIAARAGVATGSFYQYFRDKDVLLRELAEGRLDALSERIRAVPWPAPARPTGAGVALAGLEAQTRTRLEAAAGAIVRLVLDYHRRDKGLHAVLSERRHADPELDALSSAFERGLLAAIEAGLVASAGARPGADLKAIAFVLFGMVEGTVHTHVLSLRTVSDKRLVETLAASMIALVEGMLKASV